MAWKGPEGLADEVKTAIDANWATKLAAINAEYADATVLADFKNTYIGELEQNSIDGFPSLGILVEGQRGVEVHHLFVRMDATLNLVCYVLDQNEERLERRAYRVARGVVELLIEGMVDGVITWQQIPDSLIFNYSPALTGDSAFLKAAMIQWDFRKKEDF